MNVQMPWTISRITTLLLNYRLPATNFHLIQLALVSDKIRMDRFPSNRDINNLTNFKRLIAINICLMLNLGGQQYSVLDKIVGLLDIDIAIFFPDGINYIKRWISWNLRWHAIVLNRKFSFKLVRYTRSGERPTLFKLYLSSHSLHHDLIITLQS